MARLTLGPVTLGVFAATAASLVLGVTARADEGMWLFTRPPLERLKADHGFEPTPEWLEHLRKSAVRLSVGGSGSLVSPDGLVMTNHHVVSDLVQALSTPDNDLLAKGFLARTPDAELRCPGVEADVLWSIEDVTERVQGAAARAGADSAAARKREIAALEADSLKATGLKSEVVTLYQGGRYHLYRYRSYADVRLVFAPESDAAFFGGDADNFEYPRYDFDCAFVRVYDGGRPLKPEHWLRWSADGPKEGDLVLVAGHPGATRRGITPEHFEHMRDFEAPARLARYWRWEAKLRAFSGRSREHARTAAGDLDGIANARKATTGVMDGLADPALLRAKRAEAAALAASPGVDPTAAQALAGASERIARAKALERSFQARNDALNAGPARAGTLMAAAVHVVRMAAELPKPSATRLEEYTDARLPSTELELYSPAPVYDDLERAKIEWYLTWLVERLGGDDPTVERMLAGRSPAARAEELVRGCTLRDPAERRRLVAAGAAALAPTADPMLRLAMDIDEEARALRLKHEREVEGVEREAYAAIAAARFAAHGESVYPDATFTLRLAYGVVKGCDEAGSRIGPYTTFDGMFARHRDRKGEPGFDLPERWLRAEAALGAGVPLNFVCTADIIGGNSGSPVVDRAGAVVGLIFDGNLRSLVWDLAYTGDGRAVAVDARGILVGLRRVYDARELVEEITGQPAGPAGGAPAPPAGRPR